LNSTIGLIDRTVKLKRVYSPVRKARALTKENLRSNIVIVLLVEQHIIHRGDPRFAEVDRAVLASKNLYNAANYIWRQAFLSNSKYIPYGKLDKRMQASVDYCALPRKVLQWVLRQLNHDWQTFFAAAKAYARKPAGFTGRPRLPHYKNKPAGRNMLTYTRQAIRRKGLKENLVRPTGLNIAVQTHHPNFRQVRIAPHATHYTMEVVYEKSPLPVPSLKPDCYARIDLGLDNLAAVTSNNSGFEPFLVNGRPLKSINQFYNKRRAELQARLPIGVSSKRLERLTDKRNRRLKHELHLASRRIIERLVQEDIGKNAGWKQASNLGRRNNQNFVDNPHARFVDTVTYKAELVGIRVIIRDESYTSKCSFLDLEQIGKRETYAGRRVQRGLFVSANGRRIQADVNASYNIIRKEAPCAFDVAGVEGAVVHPVRLVLAKNLKRRCGPCNRFPSAPRESGRYLR
jgi:putative transposase